MELCVSWRTSTVPCIPDPFFPPVMCLGAWHQCVLRPSLLTNTFHMYMCAPTQVCVQTSMREANDRGFECCLVADASASYFPSFKASVCDMVVAQVRGLVSGCVGRGRQVC